MKYDRSDTVYYFTNNLQMDIKQFDEVIIIKNCFVFVYMLSVLLGGVALYNSGWGYYSNNHYILCVFRN